jgi:hypothetical protein
MIRMKILVKSREQMYRLNPIFDKPSQKGQTNERMKLKQIGFAIVGGYGTLAVGTMDYALIWKSILLFVIGAGYGIYVYEENLNKGEK